MIVPVLVLCLMLRQSCDFCVYKLQSSSTDYCILLDSFVINFCLFFKPLSMFIPEEMKKANKFLDVAIPSNASYFSRLGEITVPSTQFTGEQVAKLNQDKISQIEDYALYAEEMANKESEK